MQTDKTTIIKAPSFVEKFRKLANDVPLSSQLVITRWGIWLNALLNYCEHFESMKRVLTEIYNKNTISVKTIS